MKTLKTFRIWHYTQYGIGFEDRKAKDEETLKIPKWIQKLGVIEIESKDE